MSAAAASLRKGWCPGALRPMRTGDGLLVRLRITGGIVPAALMREVAACAREFGNGLVDLSARSNLQLRGVTESSLGPLTARLARLGILDADPEAEAVRNVMASPLAGLDPSALLDIRKVVSTLETRLREDRALHALPGKFGFLVDDGGVAGLGAVPMDIRFEAFRAPTGPMFAVRTGGTALSAHPVTACVPEAVPDVAAALARAFLALRGEGPAAHGRMASLADGLEPRALAEAACLPFADPPRRLLPTPSAPVLGTWRSGGLAVLGVAAPFGAWSADQLDLLAGIAGREGPGEMRLTPWRAILLPGVGAEGDELAAAGLVTDPADPRLALAACTGAPGCASSTVNSREDALSLAAVARAISPAGIGVHVSGCAKGCAHPAAAPVTLVGRDGRYDLVFGGKAGDQPALRGLGPAQAAAAIADRARQKGGSAA